MQYRPNGQPIAAMTGLSRAAVRAPRERYDLLLINCSLPVYSSADGGDGGTLADWLRFKTNGQRTVTGLAENKVSFNTWTPKYKTSLSLSVCLSVCLSPSLSLCVCVCVLLLFMGPPV